MHQDHIQKALRDAQEGLARLQADSHMLLQISEAARLMVSTFHGRRRVFSCGNGGSLCDAMHFAEELSGRFRSNRKPLAAVAISDASHITCTGNDYGYEQIFARYVEAHMGPGDVLLAISTSGTSKNILAAVEKARELGASVVSLTGKPHSPIGKLADIDICTPAGSFSDRVQELHIKVIHIMIELIEREMFPENYPA